MTTATDLGSLIRERLGESEIEILDVIDGLAKRYSESNGELDVKNVDGIPQGYRAVVRQIDGSIYVGLEATHPGTERESPRTSLDFIRMSVETSAESDHLRGKYREEYDITLADTTRYFFSTTMDSYAAYRLVNNGTI
jgi:hypothetical protein